VISCVKVKRRDANASPPSNTLSFASEEVKVTVLDVVGLLRFVAAGALKKARVVYAYVLKYLLPVPKFCHLPLLHACSLPGILYGPW